jgi:hypothetical protein
MSKPKNKDTQTPHAPGRGSDKQHPDTPSQTNEESQKKPGSIQENPGSQNTG